MNNLVKSLFILVLIPLISGCCAVAPKPIPGAERMGLYLPMLKDRSIAVVANQTSMVGKVHLVDRLKSQGINIRLIFAPEHGFREMADAGQQIMDGKDQATGIPVKSLYGDHLKPTFSDLTGIDVVVFDIQDVGVRFYTYISTLHNVLEACAENKIPCIILDRPNPNGFYFDGNIADTSRRSFVGIDPVPVVYGLTTGEYAGIANGEGWLRNGIKCDLTVIKCVNYTHATPYELPVRPSPNLPDQTSVYLYPSLCFFEGTNISVGRGTPFPFQVYGSPSLPDTGFSFTPVSTQGAKNPPYEGIKCFGKDLRDAIKNKLIPVPHLNLEWLIEAYREYPEKGKFFNSYFDVLASGPALRDQIQKGMTADEIRATWREGLEKFKRLREKYLLYK